MSDTFDEAIKEIAIRHGVVLSKDDPILILQTMNDRLIEETREAQVAMLAQFREEMEGISSQWKDNAKEKAEKILNAALTAGHEAMAKLLKESTSESVHVMKKMISDALVEAHALARQTRKFSRSTLIFSSVTLTASCLLILLFLVPILK